MLSSEARLIFGSHSGETVERGETERAFTEKMLSSCLCCESSPLGKAFEIDLRIKGALLQDQGYCYATALLSYISSKKYA